MSEPLLVTQEMTKAFGALRATDALSLDVLPGEIHAVIGPNGAGKTTAIAQISGEIIPDSGAVRFQGRDITRLPVHARSHLGLARSFQITSLFLGFTAEDNVAMALQAHDGYSFRFWRDAGFWIVAKAGIAPPLTESPPLSSASGATGVSDS